MDQKTRKCDKCQKELTYSSYDAWYRANKNNARCLSCAKKGKSNGRLGKKHTADTRLKMSNSAKNKPPVSDLTKQKLSIARRKRIITLETRNKMSASLRGRKFTDQHKFKLSLSNKGQVRSEETKYKIRLATIRDLQDKGITGAVKNYNPMACKFIDDLNKEKGWNLQHALNGGEIELYGYFVDGYDKERNIIFEYDEPEHKKGYKIKRDLIRQENLLKEITPTLFIRYDEMNNKLYEVK